MSEQKCKREGCPHKAMPYPSYGECCSLYCRDVHDQDKEIEALRKQITEVREALQGWTDKELSAASALVVIDALVNPQEPSQDDLEWGIKKLEALEEQDE